MWIDQSAETNAVGDAITLALSAFFVLEAKATADEGPRTTEAKAKAEATVDRRPWTLEAGAKSKATIGREEWGVRIPELEKRETGQSKEVGQTG